MSVINDFYDYFDIQSDFTRSWTGKVSLRTELQFFDSEASDGTVIVNCGMEGRGVL